MKLETILSQCAVPERILLISSTSTWNKQMIWKLAEITSNDSNLPYIENVPYSLFEISLRGDNLYDGRGFRLRLQAQNLPLLMLNSKLRNGRIVEPCQYLLYRKTFWLFPTRLIENGQIISTR